jgi:hypothetical protein
MPTAPDASVSLIHRTNTLDGHLRRICRPNTKVIHTGRATIVIDDNGAPQFFLYDSPRPLFTSHYANPQFYLWVSHPQLLYHTTLKVFTKSYTKGIFRMAFCR